MECCFEGYFEVVLSVVLRLFCCFQVSFEVFEGCFEVVSKC